MKKTLLTLMLLAGVTCAAEIGDHVQMGSYYTDNHGTRHEAVSNLQGKTVADIGDTLTMGTATYVTADATRGKSFTVSASDLLVSSAGTLEGNEVMQLDSLVILSGSVFFNDYRYGVYNRWITVTVGDSTTVYTSDYMVAAVENGKFGTETFTFGGEIPTFLETDTLTVTLHVDGGYSDSYFFFGGIDSKEYDYTAGNTLTGRDQPTSKTMSGAVQLNCTVIDKAAPATPEPATATLSLLALAGLAARRKRR